MNCLTPENNLSNQPDPMAYASHFLPAFCPSPLQAPLPRPLTEVVKTKIWAKLQGRCRSNEIVFFQNFQAEAGLPDVVGLKSTATSDVANTQVKSLSSIFMHVPSDDQLVL